MKLILLVTVWLGSSLAFGIAAGLAFEWAWPVLRTDGASGMIVSALILVHATAVAGVYFTQQEAKP